MKLCPVVPENCCGQVHVSKKERRIIIRNGAKTILSLQTLFGRLNEEPHTMDSAKIFLRP